MGYSPICHKAHRYEDYFESLPKYQGTVSRHKCAGCAFELGYSHAIKGTAKAENDSILYSIPCSQAGSVRHKDAFIAYNKGYNFGLSMSRAA